MDRFRNEFPEYEKEIISLDEGIKRTIKWFNLGGTDD